MYVIQGIKIFFTFWGFSEHRHGTLTLGIMLSINRNSGVITSLLELLENILLSGRELIIEMFLYQQPYLNALQTMCPHVLRYLATAVVINKNSRRAAMKVRENTLSIFG